MSKASKTLNVLLPLVLLVAEQSLSFAQGASVRDTSFTFYSLNICSGGGSVRDTSLCNSIAVVKTYPAKSSGKLYRAGKTNRLQTEVTYYRISCRSCSLLHWQSSGPGVEVSLPASARISDPELIDKLRKLLVKQISKACNYIKYK
jgi:hypothetical protein